VADSGLTPSQRLTDGFDQVRVAVAGELRRCHGTIAAQAQHTLSGSAAELCKKG
jgi:hypothetical protein